jgi:capsular exopolysaccharide synthesis family protein
MERIKQALERARRERESAPPPDGDARAAAAAAQPARPSRPAPPPAVESRIDYTQTRVIPAQDEHLRRHRVVAGLHDDAIAGAYKVLRTAIVQRMRANGWRSLGITSPAEGAGKTLTAVNLAISLAHEVNHTVLLADLDLRRPRLHRCFLDRVEQGISEYLTDDVPLAQILFNPGIERLVVLPGHKPFANSSEMLVSPRMVQLAKELVTRYPERIVLYDMPPILACDDVMAFAPHVDAFLVVVEEGKTQAEDLQRTMELLEHVNIIGTVLNKATDGQSGYGYGYGYGYSNY